MGQDINQAGEISTQVKKSVIFNRRELRDIVITENDNVTIRYINISSEGEKQEMLVIPFEDYFDKIEKSIWDLIDSALSDQKE
ncbi:hypothetical protein [Enterococcus casseliflavus]|uniref:hypothetical protein n=1 Tax=Enterococcus casseliflavus TaxID=37734 RepID=UPI0007642AE0|nr:hypothetical protein [Enterococcus casseliflavus]OJG31055.1 hypothetical protein RU99_GL002862 [Enterococcus casseliflavus]QQU22309.1 hypothetical protein I6I77_12480 [Enterococcus casseliflavus]STQ30922.1 Uncharacterised protein [Enterococcus casseliflavus]